MILSVFDSTIPRAINLTYLFPFGEPKIGEPLSEAWKRTRSTARYGPFDDFGARMISNDLLSTVFPGLSGPV
jgi:hypothetical protein